MKIAFVNHSHIQLPKNDVPLRSGSIGLWVYHMASHLAAKCEEVHVYMMQPGLNGRKDERHADIEFHGIPVIHDERLGRVGRRFRGICRKLGFRGDPRRPYYASSWHYGVYSRLIARDLKRRKVDLVHITNYPQFAHVVRKYNPDVKILLHMQCDWIKQLDRELMSKYLNACDIISGCAKYVSDGIRERFPEHAHKCVHIHNAVDPEWFTPAEELQSPDDAPEFVFTGRVSPEKGIHVLLDAAQIVWEKHPRTKFSIIGGQTALPHELAVAVSDDPLVKDLERFYGEDSKPYIEVLSNMVPAERKTQVDFIPDMAQSELVGAYRRATALVFPSSWDEPFGIPPIESMACATPVIATRSGGLPEHVLDMQTGLIVPRADPEALAQAMIKIIDEPDLRRQLGQAGRRWVEENFTWAHISAKLFQQISPDRETISAE